MAKSAKDQLLDMAKKADKKAGMAVPGAKESAKDVLLEMGKQAQYSKQAQPWKETEKGTTANKQPEAVTPSASVQNPVQQRMTQAVKTAMNEKMRQVSPTQFAMRDDLKKQYGSYTNYIGRMQQTGAGQYGLQGVETAQYKQQQAQNLYQQQLAAAQQAAAQRQQEADAKKQREERAQSVSQSEFGRSSAMQTEYGTYENYLNGVRAESTAARDVRKNVLETQIDALQRDMMTAQERAQGTGDREDADYQAWQRAKQKWQEAKDELATIEAEENREAADAWRNQQAAKIAKLEAKNKDAGGSLQTALTRYIELESETPESYAMKNTGMALVDEKKRLLYTMKSFGMEDGDLRDMMEYERQRQNAAQYDKIVEDTQRRVEQSKAPWLYSVISPVESLTSGMGAVHAVVQNAVNKMRGSDAPVDFKAPQMLPYGINEAIRSTRAKAWEEKAGAAGSFAYQTLMSMLDSAAVLGISVITAPAVADIAGSFMGAPQAAELAGKAAGKTGWLLGGSAATSAMAEAKERGLSDEMALGFGVMSGIWEEFFEKYSIERVLKQKDTSTLKKWIMNVIKQQAGEASEEAATTLANTMTDYILAGDLSKLDTRRRELMQSMSAEDAEKQAKAEWLRELGLDALGGWISGGVFGAVSNVRSDIMANRTGSELRGVTEENVDALIESGLESAPGTESRQLAERLDQKRQEGKPITDREIGLLYADNVEAMEQEAEEQQRETDNAAEEESPADNMQQSEAQRMKEQMLQMMKDNGGVIPITRLTGWIDEQNASSEVKNAAFDALFDEGLIEDDFLTSAYVLTEKGENYGRTEGIGNGEGRQSVLDSGVEGGSVRAGAGAAGQTAYRGGAEAGRRAGETVLRQLTGTEAAMARRAGEGAALREAAKKSGQAVPSASIIRGGSEAATVWRVQESQMSDGIREAVRDANEQMTRLFGQREGGYVELVVGDLMTASGQKVDGVFDPETKKITVKADGIVRGYDQLLEHEFFHALIDADPTVRSEVKDKIISRFGREEFQRIAEEYARNLGAVYAMDADRIEEDVMADAYAGMNRFADADATEFTDTAQETVMEREIAGNGQNEAATDNITGPPMRYSVREIIGKSGKNYGIGVYLDSTLLSDLSDEERILMVKERVAELGGSSFTAYDQDGNEVSIKIADPSQRFINEAGKSKKANRDLATKNRGSKIKQETVVLADELISAARKGESERARHAHGWLDNNGENMWDKWTTFVQDKENTVWEATMHVANSINGEKYLYDIDPIKKVEQGGNSPTSTTDASISEDHPIVKQRFSLSEPVEQTRTLVAMHNMTEYKIRSTLDIGAWPSPSIAIAKATQGHTSYGEYSAIFPRSVIDPEADARNKVYGSDAWTPTWRNARAEREVIYEKKREFNKLIEKLTRDFADGAYRHEEILDAIGVDDATDKTVNQLAKELADHTSVQAAYLAERGRTMKAVIQEVREYDSYGNGALRAYINSLGRDEATYKLWQYVIEEDGMKQNELETVGEEDLRQVRQALTQYWMQERNMPKILARWKAERIDETRAAKFIYNALEMVKDGNAYERFDWNEMALMMQGLLDDETIEQGALWPRDVIQPWVAEKLEGILGQKGIRNGAELETPMGNKNSFWQTHDPYTAENIVRAMNRERSRGANTRGATAGTIVAMATPEFRSIEQMHEGENRLYKEDEDEYDALMLAINYGIESAETEILSKNTRRWDYDKQEACEEAMLEAAATSKTDAAIRAVFQKYGFKLDDSMLEGLKDIYELAEEMPTEYFEAKPQRVVGFEEALAVLAPDNAPEKLVREMEGAGMNVVLYEAGNDADRVKKLNEIPNVRFSVSEDEAAQKAIEHFGKTYKWSETGYITKDGSRLDFSGRHEGGSGGYRTVDHRDIVDAIGEDYGDGSYSGGMVQFMREGNIRISPESGGINLSVMPTKQQLRVLDDYISRERGEVILDLDDENGNTVSSTEYPRGTRATKVLNDIRNYFENGEEPQVSPLAQFYSVSEDEEMERDIAYREAQERAERRFSGDVRAAGRELMADVERAVGGDKVISRRELTKAANALAQGYYENGAVDAQNAESFKQAVIDASRVVDREYYDQYEDVKKYLNTTPITLSEYNRPDMGDYRDFRRRAFGTMQMRERDGLPVDTAYGELREMAPELFPEDIINPADQLERMLEVGKSIRVIETGAEEANAMYGADWRDAIDKAYDKAVQRMERTIDRVKEERAEYVRQSYERRRAENRAAAARELLRAAETATEADEVLSLAGDEEGLDPAWRMPNTKQMKQIYRDMTASTPEDQRVSEALFWYMQQKAARGNVQQAQTALAETALGQELQDVSREAFRGSDALDAAGVKIARSVTNYGNERQIIANDKAARRNRKLLREAIEAMSATPGMEAFAKGVAEGVYTLEDTPRSMKVGDIAELADLYRALEDSGVDMLQRRRQSIRDNLQTVMGSIFDENEAVKFPKIWQLNYNSAQRNMIKMYGDAVAARINKLVFDPVNQNESERVRWLNRQMDEMRTFAGKDGKKSKLTRDEAAMVQELIEGRAVERMVAGMEMKQVVINAANEMKAGKEKATVQENMMLDDSVMSAAEKYAKWLTTLERLNSENVDAVKVQNAEAAYREKYNTLYKAINEFLVAHGMEPIGFIRDYAPHMQTEKEITKLSKAFGLLGINEPVSEIPTSIAGMTADYRPNKRWNPYFMQRTGEQTEFDIEKGFESYVTYLSDVLYHTDDIMTVRNMEQYFRARYAEGNIRNELDRINLIRHLDYDQQVARLRDMGVLSEGSIYSAADVAEKMNEHVQSLLKDAAGNSKYAALAVWLQNYGNILAGKQHMGDRGMESDWGRKVLNLGNWGVRQFGQTQVAGSISSMLNQSAQLSNILAEKGLKNTSKAVADIVSGKLRKADWAQMSDYLTVKKGVEFLVRDKKDMAISRLFAPADFMDRMMSTIAVRSAWYEAIDKGLNGMEAMRYADKYGRAVMGDRSKGGKPIAFNAKNPISAMANVFQIEALNTWEHMAKDTLGSDFRQIERESGRKKAAAALAGVIVKTILAAFALNRIADELYGGTPAAFDILGLSANFVASGMALDTNAWIRRVIDNGCEKLFGERPFDTTNEDTEFNWGTAAEELAYNVSNDVPFVRNVSGLLGLGDETLPTPLAGITQAGADMKKAAENHGVASGEMAQAAFDFATSFLPAGRQISKTAGGVEALLRGGVYSGYGEDEKLRYPVEIDPASAVQAVLFGKNALQETKDFWAKEGKQLSESQTKDWKELVASGFEPGMVYDTIQKFREIGNDEELTATERDIAKRDVIRALDLPAASAVELYNRLNYDEGDTKPETINGLLDTGMTWDEIADTMDVYKELYDDGELKAGEKATELAMWLDGQDFTQEQKAAVKEGFKYYIAMPVDAGSYEKFSAAGVSVESADKLLDLFKSLPVQEGYQEVRAVQKYEAVLGSEISEAEKNDALGAIIPAETAEKIDLLANFRGVDYAAWAKYKVAYEAKYGDASVSQEKAETVLRGMGIPQTAKAALWQIANKSWKAGSNPFMTETGEKVKDTLGWDD